VHSPHDTPRTPGGRPRDEVAAMIRPATLEDSAALAEAHVRSWRAAYRGVVPDAYLDALSVEGCAARWRNALRQGQRDVAVCEVDGALVGFVSVEPSRDADCNPGTGEVVAIYIDPAVWRRGLGRRLMDWAKDVARRRGWQRLTLWVLRDNAQARAFYEAAGFHLDGAARDHDFSGTPVAEVRYACDCDG
jgi:GNAT superfamily N-acetyltransferase